MPAFSSAPSLPWCASTGRAGASDEGGRGGLFSARACTSSSSLTIAGCPFVLGDGRGEEEDEGFVRVFLAEGSRCPWDKETQAGDHLW